MNAPKSCRCCGAPVDQPAVGRKRTMCVDCALMRPKDRPGYKPDQEPKKRHHRRVKEAIIESEEHFKTYPVRLHPIISHAPTRHDMSSDCEMCANYLGDGKCHVQRRCGLPGCSWYSTTKRGRRP